MLILGGQARHHVFGRERLLKAGDIVILRPGVKHSFHQADDLLECKIGIGEDVVETFPPKLFKHPGFRATFDSQHSNKRYEPYLHLKRQDFFHVLNLTKEINLCLQLKKTHWEKESQDLLHNLLGFLFQKKQAPRAKFGYPHLPASTLARKAAEMLEHGFQDEVAITAMSQLLKVSRRHLTRVFTKTYGSSPVTYLLEIRIKKAMKMLLENEFQVGEIALMAGFEDSNYFSRQFRKMVGRSPTVWREQQFKMKGHPGRERKR